MTFLREFSQLWILSFRVDADHCHRRRHRKMADEEFGAFDDGFDGGVEDAEEDKPAVADPGGPFGLEDDSDREGDKEEPKASDDDADEAKGSQQAPGMFDDMPTDSVDPGEMTLDGGGFEAAPDEDHKDTALAKWEAERAVLLTKRQEEDEQGKEAAKTKAAEELANFEAERAAKLEKHKKSVRQEEKNDQAALEELMSSGSTWEKVGKYVDTRKPKDHVEAEKTDRMRVMIADLKAKKVDHQRKRHLTRHVSISK
eukprot:g73809.t1